jgi:predicted sugar kinase
MGNTTEAAFSLAEKILALKREEYKLSREIRELAQRAGEAGVSRAALKVMIQKRTK